MAAAFFSRSERALAALRAAPEEDAADVARLTTVLEAAAAIKLQRLQGWSLDAARLPPGG